MLRIRLLRRTLRALTAITGAPLGGPYNYPKPYVRSDGVNSVVYGADDGHFHEIFLSPTGWQVADLTALSGAPIGAYPEPYVRSDGVSAIVYTQFGRHIMEIYDAGRLGWRFRDLTNLSGAPISFAGFPVPYVRSDGFNSIVYRGGNGHIDEIFLVPGGAQFGDLTDQAGGETTASLHVVTRPMGMCFTAQRPRGATGLCSQ